MDNDIRVEIANSTHRQGILALVANSFIKGEPIEAAMNVQWENVRPVWEKAVDECIPHQHSHVAVTGADNKVVGIRLSRILDLDTFPHNSIYEWLGDPMLIDLNDRVTAGWQSMLKGKCKKLLHFMVLSVDPAYGKRGIAQQMCLENMELGKRLGCTYCTVVATNLYSQRVFEKLSFREAGVLPYSDLWSKGETSHFEVTDPIQKSMKWYVKEL